MLLSCIVCYCPAVQAGGRTVLTMEMIISERFRAKLITVHWINTYRLTEFREHAVLQSAVLYLVRAIASKAASGIGAV